MKIYFSGIGRMNFITKPYTELIKVYEDNVKFVLTILSGKILDFRRFEQKMLNDANELNKYKENILKTYDTSISMCVDKNMAKTLIERKKRFENNPLHIIQEHITWLIEKERNMLDILSDSKTNFFLRHDVVSSSYIKDLLNTSVPKY